MAEPWPSGAGWWTSAVETPRDEAAAPSPIGGLVSRRTVYSRNSICWIAVRSWSSRCRQADVAALKAAKQRVDGEVISFAASEVAEAVRRMFGSLAGWMVSTVAVGHSRRPDSFAVRMGEAVGSELGRPFRKIFEDRFVDGVSHPKEFSKLPPLERVLPVAEPVLIVDDVATSGWHLEEALLALRQCGVPAVAIAWISGTVK